VDEFRHSREEALAGADINTCVGTIEKSAVSAVHNMLEGIINGVPRIVSHQYWWVGPYPTGWPAPPDPNGYRLEVHGEADLKVDFTQTAQGVRPITANLIASAARTVNAIPTEPSAEGAERTRGCGQPCDERSSKNHTISSATASARS
jgi:hypothetical protein